MEAVLVRTLDAEVVVGRTLDLREIYLLGLLSQAEVVERVLIRIRIMTELWAVEKAARLKGHIQVMVLRLERRKQRGGETLLMVQVGCKELLELAEVVVWRTVILGLEGEDGMAVHRVMEVEELVAQGTYIHQLRLKTILLGAN